MSRAAAVDSGVVVTDSLGAWAEQWDDLVGQSPLPSPFLWSWWLSHVAVGDPRFVLVTRGDELLGGAAFQVRHKFGCEWVELLGDGPLEPDELDLVARPNSIGVVQRAVAGWLRRPGDRLVDLVGLVESSWLAESLPRRTVVERLQQVPYAPLPDSFEQYLAGRPGQSRSTITRSSKRLTKAGVVARVRSASEVEGALEDLYRLHDVRWGERSGFLAAWPGFADAIRAGVVAGQVRFTDLVDAQGATVAIELDLLAGGRVCFYQAGRLEDRELRGSGSVLKAAVVESAIAEGATEFDLLRGDEPYKAEWADAVRYLERARVGFGPRGIAVAAAAVGKTQLDRWRAARAARSAAVTDRKDA